MTDKPEFPIKYVFHGDEYDGPEEETYEDLEEMVGSLEWFDSEDPEWNASVFDALGRPVRLKVVNIEVVIFELKKE